MDEMGEKGRHMILLGVVYDIYGLRMGAKGIVAG
jgi:hypothetical protein